MDNIDSKNGSRRSTPERATIEHLRKSLKEERGWPTALLKAIAAWTAPHETYRGRRHTYFIEGEAFEWLALAERLCSSVHGLIPEEEREDLLFEGRFPEWFDATRFKDLLGVEKYRGHLNYFYGVTVEEALQQAVERQVHKRHLSNCNQYQEDFSEEAWAQIYRAPRSTLLSMFRAEKRLPPQAFHEFNRKQAVHVLAVPLQAKDLGQGEGCKRHPKGPQ